VTSDFLAIGCPHEEKHLPLKINDDVFTICVLHNYLRKVMSCHNVYLQKLKPRTVIKQSAPSCQTLRLLENLMSTTYKFALLTVGISTTV
jgi:hypothetical protein